MIDYLKTILSDSDDASSKRFMGLLAGLVGIIFAGLSYSPAVLSAIFAYSAGCFGVSALQRFTPTPKKETPKEVPATPLKKEDSDV